MTVKQMRWGLTAVTLLAAALRWHGLFANSFHTDEALFASWARLLAVWRDPLLLTQPVDKPPLLFYLQALFYPLQGAVPWAARLPNWIASLWLAPLTGQLAWRLTRERGTAVLAAFLLAASPLHVQFSASAFTDPLLTFWLAAALLAVLSGRWGWAGVLFGLAAATKHQAWLFLPLLVGTAVLWQGTRTHPETRRGMNAEKRRDWLRAGGRWLAGFAPVWGAALLWMGVRGGGGRLWSQQMANFGGVRLAWSWELWPRLLAWLQLWPTVLPGAGLLLLVWLLFSWRQRRNFRVANLWAWNLFILFYALLHFVLAVPVWDRYLLPLTPLLAVSVSRIPYTVFGQRLTAHGSRLTAYVFLIIALLPFGWVARNGRYPVGSFPGADSGAEATAALLADAPYGTVLYDHWYSWQWRYHLFDSGVYVSWFPYPAALAQDLQAFGRDGAPRYLALPRGETADPVRRAVAAAGFALEPVPGAPESGIILLRIVPQ